MNGIFVKSKLLKFLLNENFILNSIKENVEGRPGRGRSSVWTWIDKTESKYGV